MNTTQNMGVFVRVAETGSFTAAATTLRTSTGQVSRAISDLEQHLSTRLLHRNTRRMSLTEAGERYLVHCRKILADLEFAEAELLTGQRAPIPEGPLRIHSMTSFGTHYLVPLIAEFSRSFPRVRIDLTLAQQPVDALDEMHDCAFIVSNVQPEPGPGTQRLGEIACIVCAAPSYLDAHGTPERPSDLRDHACLQLRAPGIPAIEWRFDGPDGIERVQFDRYPFVINVADSMTVAIREGMGVGLLPASFALNGLRNGTLRRLLPGYTMAPMSVDIASTPHRQLNAPLNAWLDFLPERLSARLAQDADALRGDVCGPEPVAHA